MTNPFENDETAPPPTVADIDQAATVDAAVTVKQPVPESDEDDDDATYDDDGTLGSMSILFAQAKHARNNKSDTNKNEPEGSYFPYQKELPAPPSAFPVHDSDDAMTLGSLASIFSAKRKRLNFEANANAVGTNDAARVMYMDPPHHHPHDIAAAISASSVGGVRPPSSDSRVHFRDFGVANNVDDDDDHTLDTLGNLSGIIGSKVNLMDDDNNNHSQNGDDEESPRRPRLMYEVPLTEEKDGVQKNAGRSATTTTRITTRNRKVIFCCSITMLMAVVIMAIALGLLTHSSGSGGGNQPSTAVPMGNGTESPSGTPFDPTTADPTMSPTAAPTINYIDPIIEFLQDNQVFVSKDDPTDPAFMAVQWMADEALLQNESVGGGKNDFRTKNWLQRYAVVAVDFALQGDQAASQNGGGLAIETPVVTVKQKQLPQKSSIFRNQETIAVHGVDECDWNGIGCSNITGLVETMAFAYQGLTGKIATEIHLLRNSLRTLDLAGNALQGSIPSGLYELTRLDKLYLHLNDLSGTLSPDIGNWNNMTVLNLASNRISGPIPEEIKSGVGSRALRK